MLLRRPRDAVKTAVPAPVGEHQLGVSMASNMATTSESGPHPTGLELKSAMAAEQQTCDGECQSVMKSVSLCPVTVSICDEERQFKVETGECQLEVECQSCDDISQ